MRKIKGYREIKANYIHKTIPKEEVVEKENITAAEEKQETCHTETNCFSLVVVRKIPWYKKLVRSIRNMIVIYRWRKAR